MRIILQFLAFCQVKYYNLSRRAENEWTNTIFINTEPERAQNRLSVQNGNHLVDHNEQEMCWRKSACTEVNI